MEPTYTVLHRKKVPLWLWQASWPAHYRETQHDQQESTGSLIVMRVVWESRRGVKVARGKVGVLTTPGHASGEGLV